MTPKFYKCRVCGNVILKLVDSNITPTCCNRTMSELAPNTVEANGELHLPFICRINCSTLKVVVGKISHPMTTEHNISFIALETKTGILIHYRKPSDEPETLFFTSDTPIAVYSYCNLHGLWKTEVPKEPELIQSDCH